jgi:hypothetical protein
MKKYSQKEILEEGFWKGVGNVIGGVARGVDYVAGQVAPELQRLYKDPYKAAKGLVGAIKGEKPIKQGKAQGGSSRSSTNTSTSPQEVSNIKQGLSSKQYNLLNEPTLSYVDPRTRMKYFNVQIEKNGNRINAIVDLNGNFTTP